MDKIKLYWWTIIPAILYLLLRLIYPNTIEFGFDQPRLAMMTLDFLHGGNLLNAQNYYIPTPWGNVPWGPSLLYFYASILLISPNPIIASIITSVINLISVLVVAFVGKKYFSARVGFISALILAANPWWVIFSRMVYQPTPVPTFSAIAILTTFYFLEKPKSFVSTIILGLSGILFQLYISSLAITIPMIILFLSKIRKIKLPYILFGLIFLILLFLPSAFYYSKNQNMFKAFFSVPDHFGTNKKSFPEYFSELSSIYLSVISGGSIKFQLGTGYQEFIHQLQNYPILISFISVIIFFLLIVSLIGIINPTQKNKTKRILLFVWATSPIWFISIVRVPEIVPRYFILCLPALSLLLALAISDISENLNKYLKLRHIFTSSLLILPILTIWIGLILWYYQFVSNYDYPNGILSATSDPPYKFLKQTVNWVENDSISKNYKNYTISIDPEDPYNMHLNDSLTYEYKYIRKKDLNIISDQNTNHYFVNLYSSEPTFEPSSQVIRFGPYTAYEIR